MKQKILNPSLVISFFLTRILKMKLSVFNSIQEDMMNQLNAGIQDATVSCNIFNCFFKQKLNSGKI